MVGDGVGELVSDHVDAACEVVEKFISVSENHLIALRVPDWGCVRSSMSTRAGRRLTSIFVVLAEMDGADNIYTLVVN